MVAHYKVGRRRRLIMPEAAPPVMTPQEAKARRRDVVRRWKARKRARLLRRQRDRMAAIKVAFVNAFSGSIAFVKSLGSLVRKGWIALIRTIRSVLSSIRSSIVGIFVTAKRLVLALSTGIVRFSGNCWRFLTRAVKAVAGAVVGSARFVIRAFVNVGRDIMRGLVFLANLVKAVLTGLLRLLMRLARAILLGFVRLWKAVSGFFRRLVFVLITLLRNLVTILKDDRMRSARAMAVYAVFGGCLALYTWQGDIRDYWHDYQRDKAREAAISEFSIPIVVDEIPEDERPSQRPEETAVAIEVPGETGAAEASQQQAIQDQQTSLDGVIEDIIAEDQSREAEWAEAGKIVEEREETATNLQPRDQPAPVQQSASDTPELVLSDGSRVKLEGAKRIVLPEDSTEAGTETETLPDTLPDENLSAPGATDPMPLESDVQPDWAWIKYAAAVADPSSSLPKLVIVIDDLGLSRRAARDLESIQGPLTLAFLPYAPGLPDQTSRLRKAGHELMVHMPMQPQGRGDPGRNALLGNLDRVEFMRRLDWNLNRFEGFVGINNHMGSALTEDKAAMNIVMRELSERGLLFLDSLTTNHSEAYNAAVSRGVPALKRDIFLDNDRDEKLILNQLAKAERLARRFGHAIAIGHPYPETLNVLREWSPQAMSRGVQLVSLGALMRMEQGESGRRLADRDNKKPDRSR